VTKWASIPHAAGGGRRQATIARRKALRHSDVCARRLLHRITLLSKAFQEHRCTRIGLRSRSRRRALPYLMRARKPRITELTVILQVDDIPAYQSGAPLQVQVILTPMANGAPAGAPVTQTVALQSVPTRLGGLPMARLEMAANAPARLQVKATSADIGLLDATFVENIGTGPNLRHRLNGRTVRDLNIIATYDTQT
jgi:hypothetical protein